MSIEPQYTFDKLGNPLGVFIPIDDWNNIAEELHLELPQWRKDLIDQRLKEYHDDPANTLDWDELNKQFVKEDEAL